MPSLVPAQISPCWIFEYSMLHTMINEIAGGVRKQKESSDPELSEKIIAARDRVVPFFTDAKALLMKERFALAHGVMSSIKGGDHEVTRLREKLFSSSKRFGLLKSTWMVE